MRVTRLGSAAITRRKSSKHEVIRNLLVRNFTIDYDLPGTDEAMKQILQNLSTGKAELVEAPAPQLHRGSLLIDTRISLISAGTERMLVDFGRAGLISKARQQPEKVRQVLEKVSTDGLLTTIDAVKSKLGQPIPLGYSNVGVVRESSF